jgi:hypothetical protein
MAQLKREEVKRHRAAADSRRPTVVPEQAAEAILANDPSFRERQDRRLRPAGLGQRAVAQRLMWAKVGVVVHVRLNDVSQVRLSQRQYPVQALHAQALPFEFITGPEVEPPRWWRPWR